MLFKGHKVISYLTRAGIIAALYAALTLAVYPISFGSVQFRVSEALCVLPFFFPEAVPGLFVGCVLSNILSPNMVVLDIIFGSAATLIGAFIASKTKLRWLVPLPTVIANAVIVAGVIAISSSTGGSAGFWGAYFYNFLSVGFGELVVCYGAGMPLLYVLEKLRSRGILK